MRSDVLNIKKDFSFDADRKANKSEAKKRLNNATLNHTVAKPSLDKNKFAKVRQNMKLRNFSNSSKNQIDDVSERSGSRRSRLGSNASSRGKLNLQEFSNLRFENERYKKAFGEIAAKFNKFKDNFEKGQNKTNMGKSSESGSSIVWKDKDEHKKYFVNSIDPDAVDITLNQNGLYSCYKLSIALEDPKDRKISELTSMLEEKDKVIAELKKQLAMRRSSK